MQYLELVMYAFVQGARAEGNKQNKTTKNNEKGTQCLLQYKHACESKIIKAGKDH